VAEVGVRVNASPTAVNEVIDVMAARSRWSSARAKCAPRAGRSSRCWSPIHAEHRRFVTIEGSVSFGSPPGNIPGAQSAFLGVGIDIFIGEGRTRSRRQRESGRRRRAALEREHRADSLRRRGPVCVYEKGTIKLVGLDGLVVEARRSYEVNTTNTAVVRTLNIPGGRRPLNLPAGVAKFVVTA